MTRERMIELLDIEHQCMLRKSHDGCDNCEVCDLVQDDNELHEMYTNVIAILSAKPCEDAVSREAAIRIAEKYGLSNGSTLGHHSGIAEYIASQIAALPSVQPAPVVRLLTLYEVCKMAADFHDCKLWFEPKEVTDDMWFAGYAQPVESGDTDIHFYEFGSEVPIEAKKNLYGKEWCCFTEKPTDEQREVIPWL